MNPWLTLSPNKESARRMVRYQLAEMNLYEDLNCTFEVLEIQFNRGAESDEVRGHVRVHTTVLGRNFIQVREAFFPVTLKRVHDGKLSRWVIQNPAA